MFQHFIKKVSGACDLSFVHAYLVDFDGTLADTSEANYVAYASALEEVGIPLGREQFEKIAFGKNCRQFLPTILNDHGSSAHPAAVASRKAELYRTSTDKICFNEALIFLLKNKSAGTKAALVTSASSENVRAVLSGRRELEDLFNVIVTGDDVTRHKPDPQAYMIAAQLLGVSPEHCLVFEDSEIGIKAGLAFGAHVLQVHISR